MRMRGVIEMLCDKCKREIRTAVDIPSGRAVTYGCRECRTPLLVIEYIGPYAYSVKCLRNMLGGFNAISYHLK